MGYGHLTLGRIFKGNALTMDGFTYNGTVSTYPNDPAEKWVTDSAAAGTAIATGVKTYNAAISVDVNKKPVETILEIAQKKGKATGLVTTTRITHATPAVFAAHNADRNAENKIAVDILNHKVDVLLGGGKQHFIPKEQGGKREDDRNLITEAKKMGYTVVENKDEMLKVTEGKLLGFFKMSHLSYEMDRDPKREPSLADMTKKAIEILSKDKDGFFLMVEGGRIDHAAHTHDGAAVARDVLAFDEAVKIALDFAKDRKNTLVIVTADHETGGLSIGGYGQYNFKPEILKRQKNSIADVIASKLTPDNIKQVFSQYLGIEDLTIDEMILMLNAFKEKDKNPSAVANMCADIVSRRALLGWTSTAHTGTDVPIMAYGPYAEAFTGHIDNTDIFKLMMQAMGLDKNIKMGSLSGSLFLYPSHRIKLFWGKKESNEALTLHLHKGCVSDTDGQTYSLSNKNK